MDHQNKTLHNIYRMTQPLNNRVVETNFMNLPNERKINFCLSSAIVSVQLSSFSGWTHLIWQ